jgi:hypothetical protein
MISDMIAETLYDRYMNKEATSTTRHQKQLRIKRWGSLEACNETNT